MLIGGLATALALRHRNIPVTVYEKDTSFAQRAQGYALTMQQGASALKQLGFVLDDFAGIGRTQTSNTSLCSDGQVVGCYAPERGARRTPARFNVSMPRQALRRLLLDSLLLNGGTVLWDKSLTKLTQPRVQEGAGGDGTQELHFADNRVASADVVVGADGIWSPLRQYVHRGVGAGTAVGACATDFVSRRYLGFIVILGRGTVLRHSLTDNSNVFQTLDGENRMYAMPFGKQDETMWQLSFPIVSEADALSLSAKGDLFL